MNRRPGEFPADAHADGGASRFTRILVSGDIKTGAAGVLAYALYDGEVATTGIMHARLPCTDASTTFPPPPRSSEVQEDRLTIRKDS